MNLFTSYPHSPYKSKKTSGFTIVELLIVVVVIAILAAISIVAYNGIQERANNVKTIAAAKQVINLTQAYYTAYDTFPASVGSGYCATRDNKCTGSTGNVVDWDNGVFLDELKKIGTPPDSANAVTSAGAYGVSYRWHGLSNIIDGSVYPVRIEYYLQGEKKNCGLSNIVDSGLTSFSTTGYSRSESGQTVCWSMIAA